MDDKAIYYIKYFKNDLISSLNYKSLPVYNKGIFNILFTLCRDAEYAGELCYPNGKAMTMDEIIPNMDLQPGDRKDRIKEAIQHMLDVGLLFWNYWECIEIRKYARKTGQLHVKRRPPGSPPPPSPPLNIPQEKPTSSPQIVDNSRTPQRLAPSSPEVGQGSSSGSPEVVQGLAGGSHAVVKPSGDIQGVTSEPETTEQKQTTESISKYITDNRVVVNDEVNYFPSLELLSFVGVEAPTRDRLAREYSIKRVVEVVKGSIKKAEENRQGSKPVRSLSGLVIATLEKNWRV